METAAAPAVANRSDEAYGWGGTDFDDGADAGAGGGSDYGVVKTLVRSPLHSSSVLDHFAPRFSA